MRELLQQIARLEFRKVQEPQIQIVVVDNDEFASAKNVCKMARLPWQLKYVVESKRGITYARNRALNEAGPADFITFIDDDEIPSTHWLDELLTAQREFSADAVSGPVFPSYAKDTPDWIRRGGFFEARTAITGSLRQTCACNNVLIAAHVLERVPRFDDAFALSGAEDTDFFLRVREAGYKIVWSQEAAVFETVSPKRGTAAWLLRREYQTGNGWVFCEAARDRTARTWMLRFCKAAAHVILGSGNAALRVVLMDKIGVVKSLQRLSLGIGMLAALVGHRFLAYRNAATEFGGLTRVAVKPE